MLSIFINARVVAAVGVYACYAAFSLSTLLAVLILMHANFLEQQSQ
jgi:hypothetical protein